MTRRDPNQFPLWGRCIVCREMVLAYQAVDTQEPPSMNEHAKCAVAATRWFHRLPDPPIPPGVPADMLPPWVVTSAARQRRRARRRWTRRDDGPALRVVS